MTIEEIKEAADMAEPFCGANYIDFRELKFAALVAWVELNTQRKIDKTENFDVKSVMDMFESWWIQSRFTGTAPQCPRLTNATRPRRRHGFRS